MPRAAVAVGVGLALVGLAALAVAVALARRGGREEAIDAQRLVFEGMGDPDGLARHYDGKTVTLSGLLMATRPRLIPSPADATAPSALLAGRVRCFFPAANARQLEGYKAARMARVRGRLVTPRDQEAPEFRAFMAIELHDCRLVD